MQINSLNSSPIGAVTPTGASKVSNGSSSIGEAISKSASTNYEIKNASQGAPNETAHKTSSAMNAFKSTIGANSHFPTLEGRVSA